MERKNTALGPGKLKVIQSFRMNLVQMNILEAYAILQYSMIVVAVDIESLSDEIVNNKLFMLHSSLPRLLLHKLKTMFLD